MRSLCSLIIVVGLLGAAGVAPAAADPNHPFVLVNVIDLFPLFSAPPGVPLDPNDPDFPSGWNPDSGPPPNYAAYRANPRVGTNPASITVHGDRLWVTGFHNGFNYGGSTTNKQLAWYNSLGAGEVRNILTTSGYDGSIVKLVNTVHVGPGIQNTDSFTGADYDPTTQILYLAFDDVDDANPASLPPGSDPQVGSYLAAVDVDPNSPTYGEILWQLGDPFTPGPPPLPTDRLYGGVAVDPIDPSYLLVAQNGGPFSGEFGFRIIDATDPFGFDPNDPATRVNIKDRDAVCGATFYRAMAFDAVTGDLFVRNANAAEWIPRDLFAPAAPFRPLARFIEEPDGGNGIADTVAHPNDVQLIDPNDPVAVGDNIIGAGADGILDTVPNGDDVFSPTEIVNERPIGNMDTPADDDCDDDPINGYPYGPFGQGQGFAVASASNLPGAAEDLVVANNRPSFGGGWLTDIRMFALDGRLIDQLEIACSPVPGVDPALGYYDLDYDETSGTLVVCSFEEHLVYVFKAQVDGGPAYTRFDFTRNGSTDLADFIGMQDCYTGGELDPTAPDYTRLSLNCMRMNSNSDCDVDIDDYLLMEAVWDSLGGP